MLSTNLRKIAINQRYLSSEAARGLILGVQFDKDELRLTKFAQRYNAEWPIIERIRACGPIKCGDTRLMFGIDKRYRAIAVTGLGDPTRWSRLDELNGMKENVRIAAGTAARALQAANIRDILVEDLESPQAAAEGATLAAYTYQNEKGKKKIVATVRLVEGAEGFGYWQQGHCLASRQNWVRELMEMPANLLTPTAFCEQVSRELSKIDEISVQAHDVEWMRSQRMGSLLSVTMGSEEPARFLEITYKGTGDGEETICLVGKGITFDCGGISIKKADKMDAMRADMGGAACVVGTIAALADLKVAVNVKGLIPLTENLLNERSNRPGDVVYAMNGMSVCIDNTDCEGRLILCDALCYAQQFKPKYILDVATLTGSMKTTLGDCVAGAFTNSDKLWKCLAAASYESGDRVWRLPLYKHYREAITRGSYDIYNLGKANVGGSSCQAAAFLHAFVQVPWIHIDNYGVMIDCTDQPYVGGGKGMTGRPMRTIFEFICREMNEK